MRQTAAIVVTYNRKELLEENIKALLKQTFQDFDIMIIDNASTDGTKDVVDKYKNDRIIYYNTGENIGGAGGFNFGLKKSILMGYTYGWLMDDDTIPTEKALCSLIRKAQLLNDEFSFLSSIVLWNDGKICEMNRQRLTVNALDGYQAIKDGLLLCNHASFVSYFVNLRVAEKVGLPIKDFFIYADDWEYSVRLVSYRQAYVDIDSIVIHKMKNNTAGDLVAVERERIPRYYYDHRNAFYVNRRLGKRYLVRYLVYSIMKMATIVRKSPDCKLKRICVMIKGLCAGIFFNPEIEYVGSPNTEERL